MTISFNVVIGRPIVIKIRAAVSQSYLCMNFSTPMGIVMLKGNQEVARHCYITSVTQPQKKVTQMPEINDRDLNRTTQIGTRLNLEEKVELIAFLRANKDVFGWTSADVARIPTSISMHKLSNNPMKRLVAQKQHLFGGKDLSLKAEDHLVDLDETFNNLRKNMMRLNPVKYIFSVEFGKFLGFIVFRRGIKVNSEKIKAIEKMGPPKLVKYVKMLTRKVTTLHKFVSKSTDKCLPFFKIMRLTTQKDESGRLKKFKWTPECQVAFDEHKSQLTFTVD
ncbi:hypothetical protein SLEP1_g48770 [Rubroshorea leprosula]|uniref:Uncharacterized protein n=1 Tax=Rubroshorea leprosula TaxID=152421 RepID=A0AAV5LVT2_9ROSI|nr:hypothetical protein SLEP1_g48770 [Rubroshorea leprosula]